MNKEILNLNNINKNDDLSEDFVNNEKINVKKLENYEEFEKLKNPEELLVYLNANIKYGFVGKNNRKVYSANNNDLDTDFDREYYLQSPEELLDSKHGVCFDYAELERDWFLKHKFDFKTFFLIFQKEIENSLPTHTFLAYKEINSDEWNWIESAFKKHEGIHKFKNLEDLIDDVKKKQLEYAIEDMGAGHEDADNLKLYEYDKSKFGCNINEFIDGIISK